MSNNVFDKLGGRKFVAYILTIGGGIAVHLLSEKGVTTELTALLIGGLGTFSASNAFITNRTSSTTEQPTVSEPVASEPVPGVSEPTPGEPLPYETQVPAAFTAAPDNSAMEGKISSLEAQVGELQAVTAQVLTSVNGVQEILRAALTPRKQ